MADPKEKLEKQESLPFPPTPSASIAGRTMQESVYKKRVTPRRLPADAPNILIVLIDDAGPGFPATKCKPRRGTESSRKETVNAAAAKFGLKPLNLIVWAKTNAGMGSLYRSQHDLLPLFKKGSVPHVNNVELGKRGRWRSNVWAYPGASSLGSDARRGLKDHPTVKPTAMLEDALLDLTNRGDVVIDPFLGPARPSSPPIGPGASAAV